MSYFYCNAECPYGEWRYDEYRGVTHTHTHLLQAHQIIYTLSLSLSLSLSSNFKLITHTHKHTHTRTHTHTHTHLIPQTHQTIYKHKHTHTHTHPHKHTNTQTHTLHTSKSSDYLLLENVMCRLSKLSILKQLFKCPFSNTLNSLKIAPNRIVVMTTTLCSNLPRHLDVAGKRLVDKWHLVKWQNGKWHISRQHLFIRQWRSIVCNHSARWLHVSRLKASVVYSFRKTCNETKHVSSNPGKVLVSGEWWSLIGQTAFGLFFIKWHLVKQHFIKEYLENALKLLLYLIFSQMNSD